MAVGQVIGGKWPSVRSSHDTADCRLKLLIAAAAKHGGGGGGGTGGLRLKAHLRDTLLQHWRTAVVSGAASEDGRCCSKGGIFDRPHSAAASSLADHASGARIAAAMAQLLETHEDARHSRPLHRDWL